MTSTPFTSVAGDVPAPPAVDRSGWVWIGAFAVLFAGVFHVILRKSYQFAVSDPDWSHALIVPLVSLYFVYQQRDALRLAPRRVCVWGLPILVGALVSHAFWIYPGQNHMFQGYSMIAALFGLVLFVLGPAVMRLVWLPIVFLGFAVKVSDMIWEKVALHLQLIAAKGATLLINFFGAPMDLEAQVRGSIIELIYRGAQLPPMEVAQACSGLRMLMAFVALGVAVAFVTPRPWWQRAIVVALTVPIAVAVNVVRVTVLGFIYPFNRELAGGDFHTLIGMLMLVPAGAMFVLAGWILDQLFVEDEDTKADPREPAGTGSAAAPRAAAAEAPGTGHDAAPDGEPVRDRVGGKSHGFKHAGWGAAMGAGVMLTLGGAYLLLLAWKRPDLMSLASPAAAAAGAAALALVGVGGFAALPALLRRIGPRGDRGRRAAALGLAAGVLLVAAGGQSAVNAATRAVMFKKPVPLRHELYELPRQVGSWQLVRKDPPLPDNVVETLGTEDYVSMVYEDLDYPEDRPGRAARLHVAYYTGMIDTVPHVPDRCFVGGGMQLVDSDTARLQLAYNAPRADPASGNLLVPSRLSPPEAARLPTDAFAARRVAFADPRDPSSAFQVFYFFVANGNYMASAQEVRVEGFNISDEYSFYCKVEVQLPGVSDPELARERVEALLGPMLPEIMACLPDWVDVRAGRYPRTEAPTSPDRDPADPGD